MRLIIFFLCFTGFLFSAPEGSKLPYRLKVELDANYLKLISIALEQADSKNLDLALYKAYLFEHDEEYVVIFWDAKKDKDSIGGYSPDLPGFEVIFDRETLKLISAHTSR